ncbi:MAG: hypothetical protein MJZ96_01460 [Paludibacteraceae bacterium]|nr:hypothetical protein [Paludibacteraceae bacterium]
MGKRPTPRPDFPTHKNPLSERVKANSNNSVSDVDPSDVTSVIGSVIEIARKIGKIISDLKK